MASIADITDENLDAAFAACYDGQAWNEAMYYGQEIRRRLTTFGAFLGGLVGFSRFPKYDDRMSKNPGFVSQIAAAQGSTAQAVADLPQNVGNAAAAVANAAGNTAGSALKGFFSGLGGGAVLVLGAVAVGVYFATRK